MRTEIFRTRFLHDRLFGSFSLVTFGLAPKFCTKKSMRLTLMKLTNGYNPSFDLLVLDLVSLTANLILMTGEGGELIFNALPLAV
jgi:hypothetical protein